MPLPLNAFSFLKDFMYFIFRQRGREGEREGEKRHCVVASYVPPTGDLACNPGTCPDWESNWQPFCSQAGAQSTEPHQPGLNAFAKMRSGLSVLCAPTLDAKFTFPL